MVCFILSIVCSLCCKMVFLSMYIDWCRSFPVPCCTSGSFDFFLRRVVDWVKATVLLLLLLYVVFHLVILVVEGDVRLVGGRCWCLLVIIWVNFLPPGHRCFLLLRPTCVRSVILVLSLFLGMLVLFVLVLSFVLLYCVLFVVLLSNALVDWLVAVLFCLVFGLVSCACCLCQDLVICFPVVDPSLLLVSL